MAADTGTPGPSSTTVLGMEDRDPVLLVLGVVIGAMALVIVAVGVYHLLREQRRVRTSAAWRGSREFGWFSSAMGLSLLLSAISIVIGNLGVGTLAWTPALAGLILGAAAIYRVIRFRRSKGDHH